jgi:hypothetical protein
MADHETLSFPPYSPTGEMEIGVKIAKKGLAFFTNCGILLIETALPYMGK